MKAEYDRETDILTMTFSNHSIVESNEDKPGMILDYDTNGNVVSIEVLDASKKILNPEKIEMQVVGHSLNQ